MLGGRTSPSTTSRHSRQGWPPQRQRPCVSIERVYRTRRPSLLRSRNVTGGGVRGGGISRRILLPCRRSCRRLLLRCLGCLRSGLGLFLCGPGLRRLWQGEGMVRNKVGAKARGMGQAALVSASSAACWAAAASSAALASAAVDSARFVSTVAIFFAAAACAASFCAAAAASAASCCAASADDASDSAFAASAAALAS